MKSGCHDDYLYIRFYETKEMVAIPRKDLQSIVIFKDSVMYDKAEGNCVHGLYEAYPTKAVRVDSGLIYEVVKETINVE